RERQRWMPGGNAIAVADPGRTARDLGQFRGFHFTQSRPLVVPCPLVHGAHQSLSIRRARTPDSFANRWRYLLLGTVHGTLCNVSRTLETTGRQETPHAGGPRLHTSRVGARERQVLSLPHPLRIDHVHTRGRRRVGIDGGKQSEVSSR